MENESFLEGNGIIILILFFLMIGGGFGGFGLGNRGNTATVEDVMASGNAQSVNSKLDSISQGITNATYSNLQNFMNVTQAVNTGFDSVNSNLNMMNLNISHQISDCCCSMKQMILENRLADVQNQLNQAQIVASNQVQSQYILSQLGRFLPYSSDTTTTTTT